jgi:hypothetical protein
MNARIERAMNSEDLGTRIAENGASNQKICALEAFRGKTAFLEGAGVILEFLERLEGLDAKDKHCCEIWGFFRDFCEILEGLKRFRSYS